MQAEQPTGVILAGGRSSRMGVAHKALLGLGGEPILTRVIDRIKPQLAGLLLSCERETAEFDGFGLPVVPGLLPGFRGPVAGLYSAVMQLAESDQADRLVLCPCDAPFVPKTLVQTLLDSAGGGEPAVIISYRDVLQPTFSLWHVRHLPLIRDALIDKGLGGLKQVLEFMPHVIVEWPESQPSPFFNINTPQDLEMAEEWLDRMQL